MEFEHSWCGVLMLLILLHWLRVQNVTCGIHVSHTMVNQAFPRVFPKPPLHMGMNNKLQVGIEHYLLFN